MITNVDNTLTDGGICYDVSGACPKRFHARDGLGARMLEESGLRAAVVSRRDSLTLRQRMDDLKVSFTMFGVKDKAAACKARMQLAGVTSLETVTIGDDIIDLPVFDMCGIVFTLPDGPNYFRRTAGKTLSLGGARR